MEHSLVLICLSYFGTITLRINFYMMSPKRKKILLGILVLLIAIQFIPIDRSVPEIKPEQDFLQIVNAPEEIAMLVKNACYDCHSYHTKYPWYSSVAPFSLFLQSHIKGGRQEMNLSEWGLLSKEKAQCKLEDCVEILQEGRMPMKSYANMHPEARLTEEQRKNLAKWFEQQH